MPGVCDVVDVVERAQHRVQPLTRFGDQPLVVRPLGLLAPSITGQPPVEVRGVIAQDVPDPGAVEPRRSARDDVEVDVDRLRDRVSRGSAPVRRPRSPARCPNGALTVIAVGTWNSGMPRRHATNLATSTAWPPPSPITLAQSGSASQPGLELVELQRPDGVHAGEVRTVELRLERRPQVVHRDHEIRPMDERRQLGRRGSDR